MQDPLREAQRYFSGRAEAYRTSASHANREHLDRMLALLDPQPGWRALDVATGGGHTALALAERVREVWATDPTRTMLAATARSARERGLGNVRALACAAEALPFADGVFEIVSSRIAPHHFADLAAFAREAARVLAPGGALYVLDLTTPEDVEAARAFDDLERARDGSHVRSWPPSAWNAACAAAGLVVERIVTFDEILPVAPWLARADLEEAAVARVRALLDAHADRLVAGWTAEGEMLRRVPRVELVARRD